MILAITIGTFVFGAVIGSFLNVCIYRLPRSESLVWPASHCPHCKKNIPWYYNIPVLSYLILKGRCHNCAKPISIQYPLIEITTAIATVVVYFVFGLSYQTVFYLYFIYCLIVITVIDWQTNLILNKMLLFFFGGGVLLNIWIGFIPWIEALTGSLSGGISLLFIALLARWYYKKDGLGFGDVKFAAVLGFFMGWKLVLFSLYFGFVLAAFYFILFRRRFNLTLATQLPLGPFIAISAFIWLAWGQELIDLYWKVFI